MTFRITKSVPFLGLPNHFNYLDIVLKFMYNNENALKSETHLIASEQALSLRQMFCLVIISIHDAFLQHKQRKLTKLF